MEIRPHCLVFFSFEGFIRSFVHLLLEWDDLAVHAKRKNFPSEIRIRNNYPLLPAVERGWENATSEMQKSLLKHEPFSQTGAERHNSPLKLTPWEVSAAAGSCLRQNYLLRMKTDLSIRKATEEERRIPVAIGPHYLAKGGRASKLPFSLGSCHWNRTFWSTW